MKKKATLVLQDGSVYDGFSFGADSDTIGEVVFNTSMIGYQEMLTDPSYAGQILLPTYPLIGNYGVNREDFESSKIQVRGFVVREECSQPSHYQSFGTVDDYLKQFGVPGISGVDTRSITRRLRHAGVMMGMITSSKTPERALAQLRKTPSYGSIDFVKEISTHSSYKIKFDREEKASGSEYHVIALDCGLKFNISRILTHFGCRVTVMPVETSAEDILNLKPDGILLSPGPGDPELLDYVANTVKKLIGKKPIMGICLGNQMIARAFGGRTFKLKFGHRGGNHPVKDLDTGRVYITAQNHGYAVDPDTLKDGLEVSHISLNDGTVEGVCHREMPVFAIQYHSEASPGPMDSVYLFEKFITMMKKDN